MSFEDLESGRYLPLHHQTNRQQDPSRALAASLFQVNTAVSAFQRLVNSLATSKDTPQFRTKLNNTRRQITQLVKETSAKLKQASESDHYTDVDASKKITDAKIAKDFQHVLKEFQKAQRLAAERETTYAPLTPTSSDHADEMETSLSKNKEQISLLAESKSQEIVLMENEIIFNEALIEEREQGIKEIQQQIGEVNEIFKDLAMLVHEQGAMIDDIGSHIESAQASTTQGTSQLVRASKIQKSTSSMNCLLLVIVGVALLIVVVVVAA